MTKICTRPGCEKKRNARGWCSTHYNNWKQRGDPDKFADPEDTRKKQSESAKKRIKRDGFSPGMQRKGEPGLQKGKKLGPSSQKGKKRGPMPKKTKEKISKTKTGTTPNFSAEDLELRRLRMTGENNPNFGGLSDEHKKKLSEIMNEVSNRPNAIEANRERRSKQAPLPTEKTKPNLQTRKILSDAGVVFQTEIRIQYQDEPKKWHKIDILIPPNRIIEVNGTYHHAEPRKYDDDALITLHNKKIKAIDVRNDEKILLDKIRKLGYEILVVWELDLKKDLDNTTKKILKFANSETLS